jgi:small-conductance mechanosensitive channel
MVTIGETFGEVIEKGLLVTRIRSTPRTDIIAIPNGLVMGAAVKNYSAEAKTTGATLHTTVTIGYDAPWRRVHELLISAALSTSHVREQPAPFVLQTALNDFYVSYELSAFTDAPRQMPAVYSELHQNIQDKFNEGGIEINSPHYTALRDGNTVTIPAGYRPKSYQPQAFRICGNPNGSKEG